MTVEMLYHSLQRQQAILLVKLLDTATRDTSIRLNSLGMTRKKESLCNLPARAGSSPRVTCGILRFRLNAEFLTCIYG